MAKKPMAVIMAAMMKKKGKEEEAPEDSYEDDEEGVDEGMVAASEELIDAIQSGDAEAVAMALRSFVEQC